jgi:hypothetical protein
MSLIIAAIRTGHDPIRKLPEGSFHRWLDEPLICPKCDASYNLVCDYNQSVGRFFEEESRRLIMLLKKAIFLAHGTGHRAPHLETNGVVVTSYLPPPPPKPPTIH